MGFLIVTVVLADFLSEVNTVSICLHWAKVHQDRLDSATIKDEKELVPKYVKKYVQYFIVIEVFSHCTAEWDLVALAHDGETVKLFFNYSATKEELNHEYSNKNNAHVA